MLDFERQEELESMSRHWTRRRFERRLQEAQEAGEGARVGAARSLVKEAVEPTTEVIEERLARKGRGRRHVAERWIKEIGADVAAFIGCKVVFSKMGRHVPLKHIALDVAAQVLHQAKSERLRAHAPGLFHYRMNSFQTTSRAHMARSMSATVKQAMCEPCRNDGRRKRCPHLDVSDIEGLGQTVRIHIGTYLIGALMEAFPGWLEKIEVPEVDRRKPRQNTYLVPTEEAQEWLDNRNEILAEIGPVALPMVVPPAPWGPGQYGGYRFDLLDTYPMVRRASGRQQRLIEEADMPKVYEALNRVQETPWRINQRVWEVMEEVMRTGGGMADLPETEPIEVPSKPWRADEEPEEEVLKAWKKKAEAARTAEAVRQQEVLQWVNIHTVVSTVQLEPAIWFPHNLDFRGRLYPIPQFVSPQGDDRQKGLLEFADGKELGQRGVFWLAVHGANCLGETPGGEKVSKMTLGERWGWVASQWERIFATARDPMADLWWTEADEPWQFLAFCFEWEAAHEGEPTEYVSHLPVSLDGSCNGLQHFAGMLRDEAGAKAVNVFPNERPEDVYLSVAEASLDILEKDAAGRDEQSALYARMWLASGLVDRKLCKRPTMTFGYGSKPFGMSKQIVEYLRKDVDGWPEIESEVFTVYLDGVPHCSTNLAAVYMAKVIWKALRTVVQGGFEAMAWMQKASRVITGAERNVGWSVPETNFPVVQAYRNRADKRIETNLYGGVRFVPRVACGKDLGPDKTKQANSVAPNVVHSLDAAALQLAVCMASHDGVEAFAMVHDSYGTHAADMDVLLRATRTAFFHLYDRHDVVQELYQEFLGQLHDVEDLQEVPEPPSLGSLDISLVLSSDYFFA